MITKTHIPLILSLFVIALTLLVNDATAQSPESPTVPSNPPDAPIAPGNNTEEPTAPGNTTIAPTVPSNSTQPPSEPVGPTAAPTILAPVVKQFPQAVVDCINITTCGACTKQWNCVWIKKLKQVSGESISVPTCYSGNIFGVTHKNNDITHISVSHADFFWRYCDISALWMTVAIFMSVGVFFLFVFTVLGIYLCCKCRTYIRQRRYESMNAEWGKYIDMERRAYKGDIAETKEKNRKRKEDRRPLLARSSREGSY
mmetsp:Transcript_20226/g.22485  ORF Transcript_20226/g.22485 Transcript_20226/m.22485 type:complete len:257 (-) Transcript_20226:138-908(-)